MAGSKKILFVITQAELGGAQRFLHNFIRRIHSRYEIIVATGGDGSNLQLSDKLSSFNIEIRRLMHLKRNVSPANDIKACYELKELINEFKPDDLFLLSSKAGFIGALTAKFLIANPQFKVIYRIGGWTFNDPWPPMKKKMFLLMERWSAGWKDVIIVNSKHDLDQAEALGIKPREDLVLVHNGLDTYKLDFLSKDEARQKLLEKVSNKSGQAFQYDTIVGTIANLYPAKGLNHLIETADYFKNNGVVFFVIGEGDERHSLEQMIKAKDLESKVFLIGNIQDAHKYLPAFDIFVLPSVKEGFPWTLIEAMVARLPVIATRVGAVPEIVENGKNGFITDPAKPEQMADKIKEIVASDYLRKELPIQAHQTVLFKFSEEKMVNEIEKLL